jgi:tRNA dimethylallyltransferase
MICRKNDKFLIVIQGPTAIGKTKLAIEIAKKYHTEIISADSRQMYKELTIGTAVPSPEELKTVKHHFIHNISIFDYYNASKFEQEALSILNNIFKKNNIAILAGGSGLYIQALLKGIDELPDVDKEIRESLIFRLNNEGIESLRQELKLLDPEYYYAVDLKNHKRILKALEICLITGKPYSGFLKKTSKKRDFNIISISLNKTREELYNQINKRVDDMINKGLIEEANNVFPHRNLNSLNTVGYKELFEYFENKISLNEAIDLIKRNTRKYARKQLTWFRRDENTKWFNPQNFDEIINYIETSLTC